MNPYCACIRCKAHRAVHRVADARLMALGGFWAARIWVRDFLIHVPAPEVAQKPPPFLMDVAPRVHVNSDTSPIRYARHD